MTQYHIKERSAHGVRIVASFTALDIADAMRQTAERVPVAFIEADDDYPDCADMLTETGLVMSLEPEGFAL